MPSFNLRNIFAGRSRPVEQPEYQYPHGSFPAHDSFNPRGPSSPPSSRHGALRSKQPSTAQWGDRAGPTSRGATVLDYDDRSDSSSLLTEGVLVQDADHISAVHTPHTEHSLSDSYLDDEDEGVVPARSRSHTWSSSGSTSTRSSGRTRSDHSELPPRIIPEYSRPYSEYRSEYTAGTRYTHSPETHSHERSYSSSRGHRRTKRRRSSDKPAQGPVILMFENGRGGYDNMWYVMPGTTPVIFQDSNGNEITRVGDFSQAASTRTQPPIFLDSTPRRRPDVREHQTDPGSEHYAPQATSENNHGTSRYRSARGPPTSPVPSVNFINLQGDGTPQAHHLEPLRAYASPRPNVVYMDSRGRPSAPTSSRTLSRSNSVVSDQGRSFVLPPPGMVDA